MVVDREFERPICVGVGTAPSSIHKIVNVAATVADVFFCPAEVSFIREIRHISCAIRNFGMLLPSVKSHDERWFFKYIERSFSPKIE